MQFGIIERYVDIVARGTTPGLRYKDRKMIMNIASFEEDCCGWKNYAVNQRSWKRNTFINKTRSRLSFEASWQKVAYLRHERIERREKQFGGMSKQVSKIMYEFYSKNVASKAVINARPAMSRGMKRSVLTQEMLRVLLNCSPQLSWKRLAEKVIIMVY